MRRVLLGLLSLALVPVAFACAGDDPAAPGPKPLSDAAVAETSAPVDTGTGVRVGGCSQADFDAPAGANGGDLTAQATVEITFPTTSTPAQYGNRCPKVKAGTVVTWKGSFVDHPLEPNGGDTPTPIVLQNSDPDGGSLAVTMTAKGTYGYECAFHPALMFGAIQVVP
jgi:plastocyanin